MYVDQQFPPSDSSLGPDLAATGFISWRRPSQFAGAGAFVEAAAAFGGCGRPLPSDVRPCPFAGDASLACALAALAERPLLVSAALCGRVEEMPPLAAPSASCESGEKRGGGGGGGGGCGRKDFRLEEGPPSGRVIGGMREGGRTEPPPMRARAAGSAAAAAAAARAFADATRWGMFTARLCVGGIWREYVLDDFFPCFSLGPGSSGGGGGGPCLSRAHGRALWVSMLEKAYARSMGSYSAALGGYRLSQGVGGGADAEEGRAAAGSAAGAAASVVARPAEVLGVFTGAPVLQVNVGGTGTPGPKATAAVEGVEGGDKDEHTVEELWRNIVSQRDLQNVSWRRLFQGNGKMFSTVILPFELRERYV